VVVALSGTTSTGGSQNLVAFNVPSAGSWLINVTCGWASGDANTAISISTVSGSFQNNAATTLRQSEWANMSYPITVSGSTPLYLVAFTTVAVVTVNPIWVFIARIG